MKTKDKLMLMFSVVFLLFVILIFINAMTLPDYQEEKETIERRSITFILGEDHESENRFYRNAEGYFTLNPQARTDEVIEHARSLNEVYGIINDRYNSSGQPFSELHLVVHSNPWRGLSLPIDKEGSRIDNENLGHAMANAELLPIHDGAIDSLTTVHIHACGLGNNTELVESLRKTLNNARMSVSDGYVNFTQKDGRYEKSEMEVFYAFYPTAHKPADLHLNRQLKARYPEHNINWLESLKNKPYRYNIPIEWEIKYPEQDVPELVDELDQTEWLMNQDELLDIIEKTEIPFDYFRWIVKKKHNSVKVYGKVTVICIMRELRA